MVDSELVRVAMDGHSRYERVRELGSGTFGTVMLCKDNMNNGTHVAVKLVPREPTAVTEYVVSEIRNFRCGPLMNAGSRALASHETLGHQHGPCARRRRRASAPAG
jgi:serine/threonine protein kinase